jgi:phenylacetate-CoA ligase
MRPDGPLDDCLTRQLRRLGTLPFYRRRAEEAGLELERIRTWEEFRQLPLLTRSEFEACFEHDTAWGGFRIPGVVRMNFTPSGGVGLLPEFNTPHDLQVSARSLAHVARAAGLTPDDVIQVTLSYHVLVAGRLFDEGFAELGACVVQAGAVSTDQQLTLADRSGATALMSNPSFATKLGEAGMRGIRRVVLTGEPFTAIQGRREALKEAFDGEVEAAIDTYGVSECFPVASECEAEAGMHLMEDFCVTEVVDPETGEVLDAGLVGELVITHRNKEGMPFLRYRTGDLALVEPCDCPCGARWVLPRGVFGRTDNMTKVKGVKLYPTQVAFVLASCDGVDPRNFRLTVKHVGGVDHLTLEVAGDPAVADVDQIRNRTREATLIGPNEIKVVGELADGPVLADQRRAEAASASHEVMT